MTTIYIKETTKEKHTETGRLLLDAGLVDLYGKEKYCINYNELGKPLIQGVNFSISHSGCYAVCAFSDGVVGADIQQIKKMSVDVGKRCFSEQEQKQDFFTMWTFKESFIKLIGEKIRMSDFEIKNNITVFNNATYYFHKVDFDNRYVLSLCTLKKEEKIFFKKL